MGKKCLRSRKQLLRPALGEAEHPDTLDTMHFLAHALDNSGRHIQAVDMYTECLHGRTQALGAFHPLTLVTMHGKALALSNAALYEDAISLGRQVSQS